jgi:hypothetical protein
VHFMAGGAGRNRSAAFHQLINITHHVDHAVGTINTAERVGRTICDRFK